jgi:hypothetical protein
MGVPLLRSIMLRNKGAKEAAQKVVPIKEQEAKGENIVDLEVQRGVCEYHRRAGCGVRWHRLRTDSLGFSSGWQQG